MAGLRKQKQYDWKDSNLALFGSDTERQIKKESAEQEPAWKKAGQKVGLQIWRIVKFKVETWPVEDYGKFYSGDSYIILNTYKEDGSEELLYDVHFWIGKESTQDEYGTAAYKTVELDTYLDDKPIQHREVEGHESDLFKSYFKVITYMEGGAESGFKHVKPDEYTPRLFHFCGDKRGVTVKQIKRCQRKIDPGDVYILDLGLTIYQWNGPGSNKDERFRALQYVQTIKADRSGKRIETEVLDDGESNDEFNSKLDEDEEDEQQVQVDDEKSKKLFRLSDATGKLEMKQMKSNLITKSDFDSDDVFLYDTSESLFVWIGKNTTHAEKKNALSYAHNYLMNSSHPLIPVSCFNEGKCPSAFEAALAA